MRKNNLNGIKMSKPSTLVRQDQINKIMPDLRRIFIDSDKSIDKLEELAVQSKEFRMRVPLVGAFSSGKTSLLNTFLGERIFAVNINPETALPVELHYAEDPKFIGHKKGKSPINLTKDEVFGQDFDELLPDGWIEAQMPNPLLKDQGYLTLVDMPGWDSGVEQHSRAIDNYLSRSLAYCLVVSVDEGTLHASLRDFLEELAQHNMPTLLVISKIDKRPSDQVDEVVAKVSEEVSQVLNQPPLAVAKVSARRKNIGIEEFSNNLKKLGELVNDSFDLAITQGFLLEINQLKKHLDVLINADNINAEQLTAKRIEVEQSLRDFQLKVDVETEDLDKQIDPITRNIMRLFESRLIGELNSLSSSLLHGGDIQGTVGKILRSSINDGVQNEFSPKLKNYFSRVNAEIPDHLVSGMSLSSAGSNVSTGVFDSLSNSPEVSKAMQTAISGILTNILARIPALALGPIGIAVSTLVGALVPAALGKLFGGNNEADLQEQKEEAAKNQVLNDLIPTILSSVEPDIRESLYELVLEAKKEINDAAQKQAQEYQYSLDQLEKELAEDTAIFEKNRTKYKNNKLNLEKIEKKLQEEC